MPVNRPCRMSMFFFRLHNLQRAEENKRKKRVEQQRQQQRQRRGAKVFKCVSDSTGHLTLAPSRLFERTPMSPSDSLDEIALQIPRWVSYHLSCVPRAGECLCVCYNYIVEPHQQTQTHTHTCACNWTTFASYLWLFFFTCAPGAPQTHPMPGASLEILATISTFMSEMCEWVPVLTLVPPANVTYILLCHYSFV